MTNLGSTLAISTAPFPQYLRYLCHFRNAKTFVHGEFFPSSSCCKLKAVHVKSSSKLSRAAALCATMLSSVALRAQIASIVDALSKAAVTQIAKVVEDDMVVLRLEMCQRENEIKKLKSNIEVLHNELRSVRERVSQRPDNHGRDGES